jgi:TRAP-type mannitol/chloroaromatic compound transport system substrate-binding protein
MSEKRFGILVVSLLSGPWLGCAVQPSEVESASHSVVTTEIPMRVFSASPTLGMTATSSTDPTAPNYGALKIFADKAATNSNGAVHFSPVQWAPDAGKSVIQQVGISDDGRDAAYDNGGALNPVWGFIYNSLPFGLDFEHMFAFLYERGGLALAQALVDAKGLNVKVLPVVASEPQGSGFFKHPVGKVFCNGERDCRAESSIGLEGVCTAGWTWRYLPPAQNILDRACTQLVTEGIIPAKAITFISSVPGMTVLGAVQSGAVTAFEFATALDDADPVTGFFPVPPASGPITQAYQNPGHKGLRFYHTPSWHQPFYLGWVMINKSRVWDTMAPEIQVAVEQAAHDALLDSYERSGSVQCDALRRMFTANDGQVQLNPDGTPLLVNGETRSADLKWSEWSKAAIDRLRAAADEYLESLKGGATPTVDQQAYREVLGAIRAMMEETHYTWKPNKFEYPNKACPQPMPL